MTPVEVNSESLMASYFSAHALSAVVASACALTLAKSSAEASRRSMGASEGSRTFWLTVSSSTHLATWFATSSWLSRSSAVHCASWVRASWVPRGPNCPWEAASRMTANSRVRVRGSQAAR